MQTKLKKSITSGYPRNTEQTKKVLDFYLYLLHILVEHLFINV